MNTMNRRMEIINILIIRRHITTNELAQELGVSTRTIHVETIVGLQRQDM